MSSIYSAITQTKDSVMGTDSSAQSQSGVEPPSGITGKGTAEQPYDQGNAPEMAAGSGEEPPSGITGKGTLTEPYDAGNAPGMSMSSWHARANIS